MVKVIMKKYINKNKICDMYIDMNKIWWDINKVRIKELKKYFEKYLYCILNTNVIYVWSRL